MKPIQKITPLQAARYWDKVARGLPHECWPWTGFLDSACYGRLTIDSQQRKATHVALVLDGRPRPAGRSALHHCGNPICVNPAHLYWGSDADNMRDARARKRGAGFQPGAKHFNAKLSPDRIEHIKRLSEEGYTQRVIAEAVGVGQPAVSRILSGLRWRS